MKCFRTDTRERGFEEKDAVIPYAFLQGDSAGCNDPALVQGDPADDAPREKRDHE